jgi:hypothetical protein
LNGHKLDKISEIRFEILTPVVIKIFIFCNITPCSLLKVNLRFGGICRLHLQDRRISKERNQHEAVTVKMACFSEISVDFQRTVHGVISQKMSSKSRTAQYSSRAYKGQITTYIINAYAEHTLLNVQSKQARYHLQMKADGWHRNSQGTRHREVIQSRSEVYRSG